MNHTDCPSRGAAAVRWGFILGMLAFCAFLAWHTWTAYDLRFQVEDLSITLETNRQRVLKQQYEYDEAAAAIPEIQAQLELIQPQTDTKTQAVSILKERRTELRAQRDALTLALTSAQEENNAIQAALIRAHEEAEALALEVAQLREEVWLLSQAATTVPPDQQDP